MSTVEYSDDTSDTPSETELEENPPQSGNIELPMKRSRVQPPKRYTIPTGLKPRQHLQGPSNYNAWSKDMLLLFRAHGVLHIMRDAIQDTKRDRKPEGAGLAAQEAIEAEDGGDTIISGAAKLTSADLEIWDDSDDMTMLLRADALINASIGPKAAMRVAGVGNVHLKWKLLAIWGMGSWTVRDDEVQALVTELWNLRASDFATIQEYGDKFMELRAGIAERGEDPEARIVIDLRKLFMQGLGKKIRGSRLMIEESMSKETDGVLGLAYLMEQVYARANP